MGSGEGRVAIVTGSATGLGAAAARRLASRGWRVAINYTKSEAEARATAAECERLGGAAFPCRADVARDDDCRRLAAETLGRWGRIDALVNNAGTTKFVRADDLDGLTAEDFERIFAVNVVGAWQMTRACVPALRASGNGAIVNVSSDSSLLGSGSSIAYAASKGALNTLTLGLARTLAPAIRVNAVCPGFAETRWVKNSMPPEAFPAFKRGVERITPLGRMTQPEEVADAVAWLIEGAAMITGQLLVIDGGTHLTSQTPTVR